MLDKVWRHGQNRHTETLGGHMPHMVWRRGQSGHEVDTRRTNGGHMSDKVWRRGHSGHKADKLQERGQGISRPHSKLFGGKNLRIPCHIIPLSGHQDSIFQSFRRQVARFLMFGSLRPGSSFRQVEESVSLV